MYLPCENTKLDRLFGKKNKANMEFMLVNYVNNLKIHRSTQIEWFRLLQLFVLQPRKPLCDTLSLSVFSPVVLCINWKRAQKQVKCMNFNIHARFITPTHSEAKHKYKSTHAVTLTHTHTLHNYSCSSELDANRGALIFCLVFVLVWVNNSLSLWGQWKLIVGTTQS